MLLEKIVVVDDDPRVIKSLKMGLFEYEIKAFTHGEEALHFLRKPNLIHLVILDVMMEGIDGLTILQEIKKINKDIAVIMMTAYGTKDIAIEALRLHADDFIEKPFDILEFKERVRKLMNERINPDSLEHDTDKYVDRIKRFVARNYENATLDFIGEEMSFSPKYISRVFSRKNGETFRDFKIKSKMEKAKDLLENSHMNVSEIAINLGYQSPESFMRLFKRINKLTPSQYRSQFSKNKVDYLKKEDL